MMVIGRSGGSVGRAIGFIPGDPSSNPGLRVTRVFTLAMFWKPIHKSPTLWGQIKDYTGNMPLA